MPNILLDAANWTGNDGTGNVAPPSWWTGTTYDYIGNIGAGKYYSGAPMTYGGTVNNGDVIAGSITSTSADDTEFNITINGVEVASEHLVTNQPFNFSFVLTASASVSVGLGIGDNLYSQDAVLTPESFVQPVAPNESITITENSLVTTITPVITAGGSPVTPEFLTIVTPPTNGIAATSGVTLQYTPNANYIGSDSFTYTATYGGLTSLPATVSITIPAAYNCDCDDDFPTATLAELRQRMVVRLGYAALLVAPPGLVLLLNDFLYQAQVLLYRKYSCFRTRRWFTWNIAQGARFFDFGANIDQCTKVLDPRKVEWVGISKGDNCWIELICGINPVMYRSMQQALPQYYDIRQCIEIWPACSSSEWQLRIKGDFGLLPFASDSDVTTIDAEAVFLLALANAKAHYEQPDAGTTMGMATGLIGDLTAGSHFTRRYVPGVETLPNAVPPKMVP